jgi:K+-sensing histidine kinase KdpD
MAASQPGTLARWVFALAMPGAALGLALPLSRYLDQVPTPPFVAAIFAVAWFSGFGPALLSIAFSAGVIHWFFLSPSLPLLAMPAADARWLALFGAVTILMAWLIVGRGRAQARAAASARRLA